MFDMAQPQAVDMANQPESEAAVSGSQDSAAFLTVRYNKETLPLTREAAAEYAQKGLNYDKLNGRLEKTQELLEAYDDIDAAAREYAQQSGMGEAEALHTIKQRLHAERQKQSAVNAQLDDFLKAHPDVDPRALPEAVIQSWKNGTPLIAAYAQLQETERQLAQTRQTNAQNTAASMGGAVGMGAAAPRPITEDAIKMMSPVELERNHSRIWAILTGQKE